MTLTTDLPGIVQRFRPGDQELVETTIASLHGMAMRRLRTYVSWAEYEAEGGEAWYQWLLNRLATAFDLLPCLHATPRSVPNNGQLLQPKQDQRAFADFVNRIITTHGDCFDSVEIVDPREWTSRVDPDRVPFRTMIAAVAACARQRGKRVVLGVPALDTTGWLRRIGDDGILNHIDALGLHGCPSRCSLADGGSGVGDWDDVLEEVRATVHDFNPGLALWITETGYSTWQEDPFRQVQAFLHAVDAPAERLYWYQARDLPADGPMEDRPVTDGSTADVGHRQFGLHDADGQPKLLGRMLRQGLPAVRNVAGLNRRVAVVGRKPPILITGGAGFIGSALADRLASEGESVLIYDSFARPGVEGNAAWLRERHPRLVSCAIGDIRDQAALADAVRDCAAVFHFAAQVAVTTSLANPAEDLQVNLQGTFNVLQALRRGRKPCIFASTNKVYGAMEDLRLVCSGDAWQPEDATMRAFGCDEDQRLDFRTPYGCSKGAADQYVLDFARSFDVPTVVMRMSCIYGPRQLGTEDQGWVAHFVLRALAGEPISIYGDGRQVRDILFIDDAVAAYVAAWRNIGRVSGQAFNLGGGPDNAVSLLRLIDTIRQLTGQPIELRFAPWRPNDQRYYVSDTRKVGVALALSRPRDWRSGVGALVEAFTDRISVSEPAGRIVA